jgi:hypothetical protein
LIADRSTETLSPSPKTACAEGERAQPCGSLVCDSSQKNQRTERALEAPESLAAPSTTIARSVADVSFARIWAGEDCTASSRSERTREGEGSGGEHPLTVASRAAVTTLSRCEF